MKWNTKVAPGDGRTNGGKRPQIQHANMGMRFGGVEKLNQGTELMPCRKKGNTDGLVCHMVSRIVRSQVLVSF